MKDLNGLEKVKLTNAQIERLEAKARNCRDNARAEQVVVDAFRDEYLAGLSGPALSAMSEHEAALAHRHMMETYDFYIGGQRRAKDYIDDAELFETAASLGLTALKTLDAGGSGE